VRRLKGSCRCCGGCSRDARLALGGRNRPAPVGPDHGGDAVRQDVLARGAVVGRVFIPRSEEIDAAEDALRYALVAFVSGKRAYVALRGCLCPERVVS
jgi:hypothetical protein